MPHVPSCPEPSEGAVAVRFTPERQAQLPMIWPPQAGFQRGEIANNLKGSPR
jgi:hypothetical protein